MRYTRNLEAMVMGQKLNLYQKGLAKQEYDWLKEQISKNNQLENKNPNCKHSHSNFGKCSWCGEQLFNNKHDDK